MGVLIAVLAAAGQALGASAPPTPAAIQPIRLQVQYDDGQARVYERAVRTEAEARNPDGSQRTVSEVAVRQEDVVVTWDADKKTAKIVTLQTPSPERLIAVEINGKDHLADYTDQSRLRPLAPVLMTQRRGARGELLDRPAQADNPLTLLDLLYLDMLLLPPSPVKPGDVWERDVDYGLAKAHLVTRFTTVRPEGEKAIPCAVLDVSGTVAFSKELAVRLKFEKLDLEAVVATDGTGVVSCTGTTAIVDSVDKAESRLTRRFEEKLARSARLDGPSLEKVRGHLAQVEKAIDLARADNIEGALAVLEEYLKDNSKSSWAPAVQTFRDALNERLLVKKALPPIQLRLILRDLQTQRDRQLSQQDMAGAQATEVSLRQLVRVNAATLLNDVGDTDPVVRDLSAFGLAFLPDPQAIGALARLATDPSAQVRGSAVVGLTIVGQPLDGPSLATLLGDPDARVKGATALLAVRTLKREDPVAGQVLPLLVRNLKVPNLWARRCAISASMALANSSATPAVAAALVTAYKEEKEPPLQPAYLAALKVLTGKDAAAIEPYEEWVTQHPSKPLELVPIEKMTSVAPYRPAAPTMSTTTTGSAVPALAPILPPLKLPGIVAPVPTTSLPQPKLPGTVLPPLAPVTLPDMKVPDAIPVPSMPMLTPRAPDALPPPKMPDPVPPPDAKGKDAPKAE